MRQEIARFSIQRIHYLDSGGNLTEDTPAIYNTSDGIHQLLDWYRMMVLARAFDAKAINLQRTGQMGTYASSEGQEAVGVGVAGTMTGDDVLIPTYRDQVAQMARADTPEEAMTRVCLAWGGDERGHKREGKNKNDWPMCIPIATQAAHAVGVGMAIKIRKQNRAVVCILGDGATSKGDVHEAMNWAGVWQLPVVFVIENNQYAISQSRKLQSGAETLAQLGVGAGIKWCKQVDGNDVIAVYEVMSEALARARTGQGPTVVEALTYRIGNHTTADDASRYRPSSELEDARKNDPIIRLRLFLERLGEWNDVREKFWWEKCKGRVENAMNVYRSLIEKHPQTVDDMFVHLHAKLPVVLKAQLAEASLIVQKDKEIHHGS